MIRVGVLRGGTSKEYNESLANGAFVLRNLPRDMYEPVDLFIDSDGVWHHAGLPLNYDKLKQKVDIIWNALYGYYGADGQVQQELENIGIPYVGSGPFVSALSMNKKITKDYLAMHGAGTPQGLYVENWGDGNREETVAEVVSTVAEKFSPPWIIEPIALHQSAGAIRAKDKVELFENLYNAFDLSIPVIIEQEIFGDEISVIVVKDFRNKEVYTFLPLYKDGDGYKTYRGDSAMIQDTIAQLHDTLNLGQYAVYKCVIDGKGNLSVKGVETQPALHPESPLHHALAELGVTFSEFAKHLISGVHKNK
jgi:D-alanine--D-alanine ligase